MVLQYFIVPLSVLGLVGCLCVYHYLSKTGTEKTLIFNNLLMYACLGILNISFPCTFLYDYFELRNGTGKTQWDGYTSNGWFHLVNSSIGSTFITACIGGSLQLWFKFTENNFLVSLRPILRHMASERMHNSIPRILLLLIFIFSAVLAITFHQDIFRGVLINILFMCTLMFVFGCIQVLVLVDLIGGSIRDRIYSASAGSNRQSFIISFFMGAIGIFFPGIFMVSSIVADDHLYNWYSKDWPTSMQLAYTNDGKNDFLFILPAISSITIVIPYLKNKKFQECLRESFGKAISHGISREKQGKKKKNDMESSNWVTTVTPNAKTMAMRSFQFDDGNGDGKKQVSVITE